MDQTLELDGPPAVPDDDFDARRMHAAIGTRLFSDEEPVQFGRYQVLGRLGRGGLGVVYRGHDPRLDRDVALKVVGRQGAHGTLNVQDRARILREAAIQARIAHPNVVPVYDVGVVDDQPYIAMELVDGVTLRTWMAESRPSWRVVLRVFIGAGRGLIAAHAVDLVHRDFKPANVMLGADQRARVLDFGLAKSSSPHDSSASGPTSIETLTASGEASLTATGQLLGTPAYMAPEQLRGKNAGPHTDIFSFCVSLFEALYGRRPFRGKTVTELLEAIEQQRIEWSRPTIRVPRRLARIVRRGLQADPDRRWPSMDVLVRRLESAQSRRSRGLVVAGAATAATALLSLTQPNERCSTGSKRLAGVWDDPQRSQTRTAFLESGESYASDTWERIAATVDDYRARWIAMYTETCEATVVHESQAPAIMDLRMDCLRRAQLSFEAVADTLAEADGRTVRNAHNLVEDLPPLSQCEDVETLEARVSPPSDDDAEAVDRVRALVAKAKAQRDAGDHEAALTTLDEAQTLALTVDYEPINAEIGTQQGMVLSKLGRTDEAKTALEAVLQSALTSGPTVDMLDAASMLLSMVGEQQRRPDEAQRYVEIAQNLLPRFPEREHDFHAAYGVLLRAQGRYDEAGEQFRRAVELYERTPGTEIQLATCHINIANVLFDQVRYAEAEAEHRKALGYYAEVIGPAHPEVAVARNNLANTLAIQGKREEAETEFRAAIKIGQQSLGDRHLHVVLFRSNFAAFLSGGDDHDVQAAEAELRTVISIWEKAFDPNHHHMGGFRLNLAGVLLDQGRALEAEEQQRQTVELWQKSVGPDHPDVALARNNLAGSLHEQGRYSAAEVEHRRALAIRLSALGPEHPDIANSRMFIADLLIEQDKPAEALPFAEEAWTRLQQPDVQPKRRGEAAFLLAQVLWSTRANESDRARVGDLAQTALDAFTQSASDNEGGQVTAWLETRSVVRRLP